MMLMDSVKELNELWHTVNMRMKSEMSSGRYSAILGVSMVELSILQVIETRTACMMKNVSNELNLSKSTLTSAAKRLEMKGYIMKGICPNDKRAYNLELTPLGHQAQKEHRDIEEFVFHNLLGSLSREEINIFVAIFRKAVLTSSKYEDVEM